MGVGVATRTVEERRHHPGRGAAGLDGVLRALRAPGPGPCRTSGAASCGTWLCSAVVTDVRDGGSRGAVVSAEGEPDPEFDPDPEFEAVLVRRLAHRYLRVVADRAAGRPVPQAWGLVLASPTARPARLALAGAATLLGYDLMLAVVGTCTVLGRTPGVRECAGHHRVAALLAAHGLDMVRRSGDPGEVAAAAGLGAPAVLAAAWARAAHLWTMRGRPAEAEAEHAALDLAVRTSIAQVLAGTVLPVRTDVRNVVAR